jgi:hypothetical protein
MKNVQVLFVVSNFEYVKWQFSVAGGLIDHLLFADCRPRVIATRQKWLHSVSLLTSF